MRLTRQITELQKPTPSPTPTITTDPTANWKTYTNTKYNFSIKYPSSWNTQTIIRTNEESGSANVTGTDNNIEISNDSGMVVPSIHINILDQSLEKEIANYQYILKNSPTGGFSNIKQYSGNFMGMDATVFEMTQKLSSNLTTTINTYYFKLPTGYGISVTKTDQNSNLNQKELDQILSTFQFSGQTSDANTAAITTLVNNFYAAMANQDGKTLFGYMTPPVTAAEKTDFNWLTGADLGANPEYRVFIRSKINNQKITNIQKQSDGSYLVSLTDQSYGYSNAGPTVGFTTPQTRTISMIVVNSGGNWLVNTYTYVNYAGGNAQTLKYNGFGQ